MPQPIDAFVISRLALLLVAYLGMLHDPSPTAPLDVKAIHDGVPWGQAFPDWLWIDGWVRWDAAWYRDIFVHGYRSVAGQQSNVAFFPLFPLLAGLLSYPLQLMLSADQAFYVAGILLSYACFFVALLGVQRLASELLEPKAVRYAIWLLSLFPYSLYLSAPYTESLFLSLTVWALLWGRHGRWAAASAIAGLASATRSAGVLLAPVLALEHLRQHDWRWRNLDRSTLYLGLTPLGLAAFIGWQWYTLGQPLAFMQVQQTWGRSLALPPLALMWRAASSPAIEPFSRLDIALQLLLIVTLPLMIVFTWRRLGWYLGLWAAISVVLPLASGQGTSLGRYSAVVFPIFLGMAPFLRRRWSFGVLMTLFSMLSVLLVYGFSHWHPPV